MLAQLTQRKRESIFVNNLESVLFGYNAPNITVLFG